MRFSVLLLAAFFVVLLLTPNWGAAQSDSQEITVQPGATRDEMTFSTENGPQYIVVRDFKVTEVQPTGNDDEFTLTLLALTAGGEPDQRVVGGILFEIDGKSTLVPFEQGGVGDLTVKAQPGADELIVRAVDSNVSHNIDLPRPSRLPWILSGVGLVLIIFLAARRRRVRAAAKGV